MCKAWFGNLFRAFPDFAMEVADMVAYGDKAAVRWTATGTFTGPGKFEGLAPTGARVELEGLDLLTIEDGLIVENRAYTNATEMARQMGAMPPAGSVGEKAMLGAVNARTAAVGAIQRLREPLASAASPSGSPPCPGRGGPRASTRAGTWIPSRSFDLDLVAARPGRARRCRPERRRRPCA